MPRLNLKASPLHVEMIFFKGVLPGLQSSKVFSSMEADQRPGKLCKYDFRNNLLFPSAWQGAKQSIGVARKTHTHAHTHISSKLWRG